MNKLTLSHKKIKTVYFAEYILFKRILTNQIYPTEEVWKKLVSSKDKKSDSTNRQYLKKIEKILSNVKEQRKTAFIIYGKIEKQVNNLWTILSEWPIQDLSEVRIETTQIEIFKPDSAEYPPVGRTCESNYDQALAIEEKAKYANDFLKEVLNNIEKFHGYLKKLSRETGLPTSLKDATEQLLTTSLNNIREIVNELNDHIEQIEKYSDAATDIIRG